MPAPRKFTDICIRGVVYPGITEASAALGVSRRTVRDAIRRGTLDGVGKGQGFRPMMRVRIRGKTYPDVHAAAAALKVTAKSIYLAMRVGRPDRVGLKRKPPVGGPKPIPFVFGGRRWPSLRACEIECGLARGSISRVMRRGGDQAKARLRERIMAGGMAADAARIAAE